MRKTAESPYSYLGALVSARLQIEKYFGTDDEKTNTTLCGQILNGKVWIPQLLPFENPSRFTLNFPFSVYFTKYFNFSANWGAGADMVLFSYEIQDADFSGYVFFYSIVLDAGVKYLHYLDNDYIFTVNSSLYLKSAINTGFLTKVPADIGIGFEWQPYDKGIESLQIKFKFALNL